MRQPEPSQLGTCSPEETLLRRAPARRYETHRRIADGGQRDDHQRADDDDLLDFHVCPCMPRSVRAQVVIYSSYSMGITP